MEPVPRVALGTFLITDEKVVKHAIKYAIEVCGYRHIDTASIYRNEKLIGDVLHEILSEGKIKREELFITSKLSVFDHRPEDVAKAARQSLSDLQCGYIDLYLNHFPFAFKKDENGGMITHPDGTAVYEHIPLVDTWKAMEKLVDDGIVKRIGVSNFTIEHMEKLRYAQGVRIQPFCNQVEMHLYNQCGPMREYLKSRNIYIAAYSPLGMSTEFRFKNNLVVMDDPVLNEIAKEMNISPQRLELKFLLQLGDNVMIVPKSAQDNHIKENISLDFTISESNMNRLKGCERCYKLFDSQAASNHDWHISEFRE